MMTRPLMVTPLASASSRGVGDVAAGNCWCRRPRHVDGVAVGLERRAGEAAAMAKSMPPLIEVPVRTKARGGLDDWAEKSLAVASSRMTVQCGDLLRPDADHSTKLTRDLPERSGSRIAWMTRGM